MKKLILVFVAIAITAGAYAQADSTNRKMSPRDMNDSYNQNVQNNAFDKPSDGVMMQNGKMMKVKNGQVTTLENDMTLSNGTKIMYDGTYINKDGTKMKMKEGEHMDMSGTMNSMNSNMNRSMDRNQKEENKPCDELQSDGVMMHNGQMMKVKNGQMTTLDHDMTMSNGTKIMSDGTCIQKDGKKIKMKDGQRMDMSGNISPMEKNKDKNMYLVPDSSKTKVY